MDKRVTIEPYIFQILTLGSGIFPSVMLSQWAFESNYGTSVLAKNKNNFFGIKDFKNGGFKSFLTKLGGYYAYIRFLKDNGRYKGVFGKKTPEEQIKEIARSGYAGSESNYSDLVLQVMKANDFKKYDSRIELLIFLFPISILLYLKFKKRN